MKILFIIPDFGSFNNFLAELSVRLVSEGYSLHVICSRDKIINFEDKYDYASLGIQFHYISYPRHFNFFAHLSCSRAINNLIESINPDKVHVHFARGVLTTVLLKKPKCHTVGMFHGLSFPIVNGFTNKVLFYLIEHFSFLRINEIWVLNSSDYDLISRKYPAKAYLLKSLGLGCDINRFDPSHFSDIYKENLREELKINRGDFVFTYTGRFVQFKGFHKVLAAFEILRNKYKANVKLIMIGGYDSLHPTGLSKREEDELRNKPDIILAGFTSEIEKYLSITDLFVFPSSKEGMPVCIMEALAMGVPVVTTDSRGCNELIQDGYNGMLTSADPSVEELVDKIIYLINHQDVLKKLSENALKGRHKLDRNNFIHHQIDLLQNT